MADEEQNCNTDLCLGLPSSNNTRQHAKRRLPLQFDALFPADVEKDEQEVEVVMDQDQKASSENSSVEEEKGKGGGDQGSCSGYASAAKKLRLTKEQAILLENSFREHRTLKSTQKHDLAKRLNLQPRQVEVWFQNKRARTKLKQTEMDHEFLKICCENLKEENNKLKRELQELKSVKLVQAFRDQLPKLRTPLAVCNPSENSSADHSNKKTPASDVKPILDIKMNDSSLAC